MGDADSVQILSLLDLLWLITKAQLNVERERRKCFAHCRPKITGTFRSQYEYEIEFKTLASFLLFTSR